MFKPQARQTATGENPVKSPSAPSQVPANVFAAAAAYQGESVLDTYTILNPSTLLPPNEAQLHSLLAVPAGMVGQSRRNPGKKSGRRASRLAREGQIISRMFDALGSRPQPSNGLSLEQGIQMELTVEFENFLISGTIAGASVLIGRSFAVSDFSAATSLLSVFDQYRFEQIEVWLETKNPNGVGDFPTLYSAVDLDDNASPTSLVQIQDHQGSIVAVAPAGHYHRFRPHMAVASYSGAFTSYANVPATWIDSASPNVQHYGFKAAAKNSVTAFGFALTVRAVLSFRAPAIN
jgi:hypothetical protein